MRYRLLLCVCLLTVGLSILHAADAELLSLPEGTKCIESESFAGISADRVYFPSGIEYIADDAFSGASFIGEGASGTYAQEWCLTHGFEYEVYFSPIEDFEWKIINGSEVSITRYIGTDEKVFIPQLIDDCEVVQIDDYAFQDVKTMRYVYFPSTLEKIGYRAFLGCSSLVSVDLPDSLIELGGGAFKECSSLTHFGYPINISKVGGVFLYGCTSLKEVTVPEGVYRLMDYFIANAGCVEKMNLPSTLEEIGKYSFAYNNAFTTIDLPESLEKIGDHAFYQCPNLETLPLPSKLDRIEESAFEECTGLKSIDLPESVTYLGWKAFGKCTSLTHFGYPVGIKSVGGTFIAGCTSLTEITVPEGVTRLVDFFVSNQGTVTEIHLPSTLKTIGKYAFYGNNAFDTVTIPDGVETIEEQAFACNSNITHMDIPGSVKSIGLKAFDKASGLQKITFHDGLESISALVFRECTSLKSISLPNTLTTIGAGAFQNCTALKTFESSANWTTVLTPGVLSNLAYEIGPGKIFDGCTSLRAVTLPEGMTSVPYMAFSYAPALEKVVLPSTITSISQGAFFNAKSLREINFPDGLLTVGVGAFKNCENLRKALLPDSVETLNSEAFYNCTNLNEIHYPKNWNLVQSVGMGDSWGFNLFGKGNIFGNDYKITSVEIPEGATWIAYCAFQNCTGLKSVTVPSTVTSIGENAFQNCSSLPMVYISPSVTSISGNSVFSGCDILTVWCEYGSTILQYCKDNNVPYYYLTPDGVNSPSGTLYKGDPYGLHGYARASIPLTNVTATIWNSDKTEILQQYSVNPNTTDYSIADELNYHMVFSALPLGSYCYTLTASTELSEEVWADTSFRIVPPPLRIYSANLTIPYGFTDGASSNEIGGTVISNYPITRITVSVSDISTGATVRSASASPNAGQFDLATLNGTLSFQTLDGGAYAVSIVAVSNGETRTLKHSEFQTGAVQVEVTDDNKTALLNFVKTKSNRDIFTTEYIDYVINDQSWVEQAIVLYDNLLSVSIFERLENILYYNGMQQNLIELYEKEIIQLISEGAYDQLSVMSTVDKKTKDVLSVLKTEGKLTQEVLKEFNQSKAAGVIFKCNELIKSIQLGISTAKKLEEAYEKIAVIIANYAGGLQILDYFSSSIDVASEEEFRRALDNLYEEYANAQHAILDEAEKIIRGLVEDYVEDQILDVLKELVLNKFTGDLTFKFAKLFGKLAMKATGLDEVADTYNQIFVQRDLLGTAIASYQKAFDKVKNGDTSDEALNELLSAIYITRNIWARANDTFCTLPRYIDKANEYLIYRGSDTYRIVEKF